MLALTKSYLVPPPPDNGFLMLNENVNYSWFNNEGLIFFKNIASNMSPNVHCIYSYLSILSLESNRKLRYYF